MLALLLFTNILVVSYLMCFARWKYVKMGWMDENFTTAIKGIGILTVVWAHTGAHFGVDGIQFVAGAGVALFLICSGYGLECSYQKNGLRQFVVRRLLRVCIPFWIVEFIGLLISGELTVQSYFLNALFIDCTWYLQFIMIWYIVFYFIKLFVGKMNLRIKYECMIYGGLAIIWFVVDSCFFADVSMPFLRARQMLCFPLGILIAKYKKNVIDFLEKKRKEILLIGVVGSVICCIIFMLITQLSLIKNLPFIIQNVFSLFTCLPLAVAVLILGFIIPSLFESVMLYWIGVVSYEVFLIHSFVLSNLGNSFFDIFILIMVTGVCSLALHVLLQKGLYNHGRFNRSNSYKK